MKKPDILQRLQTSTLRSKPPRAASLRSHLLGIVLVGAIPLLVFAVGMVILFTLEQRATFRRGATDRTRALVTAVDTELKRSIAALEALATSEHLQSGHLAAFHAEAGRVLKRRPEWLSIQLAPRSGRLVLSLQRPFGAELHDVEERASFDKVFWSRRPTIGDLFREPITNQRVFAVRVPVARSGAVEYVLSALVKPRAILALLSPQELPQDWVGVVLDGRNVIVARTVDADRRVGQPASDSLRGALARSPRGWFHGTTVEGWDVYTPYNRSAFSGWTVALGIPAAAVEAPFHRSLLYLASFGVGSLSVGVALAWLLSRRSAQSIEALARMADDLGLGKSPSGASTRAFSPTGVAEVEGLKAAFSNAARLIQARSEERDRVESSLREAEAAVRESDRRKDQFLAMLGHELRNPLGVISTAVQLLKMGARSDQELTELRQMIERQVADMTRLLDDLLDVSRIAQGRIQAKKKLCDLVAVVRDTTADRRGSLEKRGLRLEADLPDRPLWVMGDSTRLSQALANLLDNAGKFTNAGGTVTVRLVEAPEGEEALLTVSDTGVGMEPEILEHAFEPFSQADRTIDRSRGGLGLGLALVKGLVELHGGAVRVHSEGSGRGTEFTVLLPLEPATLPARPADDASRQRGRPHRILVVEDNRMAARSLEMFLVNQGHAVEVAHSGPAGIEAARRFRPEVVLCDIGLPQLDGYDVARALRAEDELDGVCLIAVTGYGQGVDQRNARVAGFDRHLTKPVNLDELHDILAELEPGA